MVSKSISHFLPPSQVGGARPPSLCLCFSEALSPYFGSLQRTAPPGMATAAFYIFLIQGLVSDGGCRQFAWGPHWASQDPTWKWKLAPSGWASEGRLFSEEHSHFQRDLLILACLFTVYP